MVKQYIAIAQITQDKKLIGLRLLDVYNGKITDATVESVKSVLQTKGNIIENVAYTNGDIVGCNGSLTRLPILNEYRELIDKTKKAPVIIINTIDAEGYRIADYQGKMLNVTTELLIDYCALWGIANGRLTVANGRRFISCIQGTYENVGRVKLGNLAAPRQANCYSSKPIANAPIANNLTIEEQAVNYADELQKCGIIHRSVIGKDGKITAVLQRIVNTADDVLEFPIGLHVLDIGRTITRCTSVDVIILPEGLEVIAANLFTYFEGCNYVYIPKSTTLIGAQRGFTAVVVSESNSYAISWAKRRKQRYIEISDKLEIRAAIEYDREEQKALRAMRNTEQSSKTSRDDKITMALAGLGCSYINDPRYKNGLEMMLRLELLDKGGKVERVIDPTANPGLVHIPFTEELRSRIKFIRAQSTKGSIAPEYFNVLLKIALGTPQYTRILDSISSGLDNTKFHIRAYSLGGNTTSEIIKLSIGTAGDNKVSFLIFVHNDIILYIGASSGRDDLLMYLDMNISPPLGVGAISDLVQVGDNLDTMMMGNGIVGGKVLPQEYNRKAAHIAEKQWMPLNWAEPPNKSSESMCLLTGNIITYITKDGTMQIKKIERNIDVLKRMRTPEDKWKAQYDFLDAMLNTNKVHTSEVNYNLIPTVEFLLGMELHKRGITDGKQLTPDLLPLLLATCWINEIRMDKFILQSQGARKLGTVTLVDGLTKISVYNPVVSVRLAANKVVAIDYWREKYPVQLLLVEYGDGETKAYAIGNEISHIVSECEKLGKVAAEIADGQKKHVKARLDKMETAGSTNIMMLEDCMLTIKVGMRQSLLKGMDKYTTPVLAIDPLNGMPWLYLKEKRHSGSYTTPLLRFKNLDVALEWTKWFASGQSDHYSDIKKISNYIEDHGEAIKDMNESEIFNVMQSIIRDDAMTTPIGYNLYPLIARQKPKDTTNIS